MKLTRRALASAAIALLAAMGPFTTAPASARTAEEITEQGITTLHLLEEREPSSRLFARNAKAILVFPSILKAGFIFGGESGNGVLLVNGHADGYYNLSGGSWGLQIGGQDFSYVVFFMNNGSVRYLRETGGFAAGTGPSIVVINKSAAAEANTTTIAKDVVAYPFNGKGLMADLTLQGTKITRIHPR